MKLLKKKKSVIAIVAVLVVILLFCVAGKTGSKKTDSSATTIQATTTKLSKKELEEQAKKIDDAIAAIGTVSLERAEAVKSAQKAYDDASPEVKELVKNVDVLKASSEKLKAIKQEKGKQYLAKLKKDYDKVQQISFYTSKQEPAYADTRCFVLPYIGQDNSNNTWLRLKMHYTEDDWVFFDYVIFSVDGYNTTISPNRSEIIRDNDGGVVWETADIEADNYIDLLWKIANSKETIVRFQGSDYYFDFTIKDADKAATRDVLTAYEAFAD